SDGMDHAEYDRAYRESKTQGFGSERWTMWDFESKPRDQVVLLRTGKEKAGLIGFGLRWEGDPVAKPGRKRERREYPVRFYNLRALDQQPFISRDELQRVPGFWRRSNFPFSGTKLKPEELGALEACCRERLGSSLAKLCSESDAGPSPAVGPDAQHD